MLFRSKKGLRHFLIVEHGSRISQATCSKSSLAPAAVYCIRLRGGLYIRDEAYTASHSFAGKSTKRMNYMIRRICHVIADHALHKFNRHTMIKVRSVFSLPGFPDLRLVSRSCTQYPGPGTTARPLSCLPMKLFSRHIEYTCPLPNKIGV